MAFNIWERWPWTSFQNLNLDWLMKAVKESVKKSEEAIRTATEARNGRTAAYCGRCYARRFVPGQSNYGFRDSDTNAYAW